MYEDTSRCIVDKIHLIWWIYCSGETIRKHLFSLDASIYSYATTPSFCFLLLPFSASLYYQVYCRIIVRMLRNFSALQWRRRLLDFYAIRTDMFEVNYLFSRTLLQIVWKRLFLTFPGSSNYYLCAIIKFNRMTCPKAFKWFSLEKVFKDFVFMFLSYLVLLYLCWNKHIFALNWFSVSVTLTLLMIVSALFGNVYEIKNKD